MDKSESVTAALTSLAGLRLSCASGAGASKPLSARMENTIPAMIPVEMCYLGWQESLLQLAKLVEPEIPG